MYRSPGGSIIVDANDVDDLHPCAIPPSSQRIYYAVRKADFQLSTDNIDAGAWFLPSGMNSKESISGPTKVSTVIDCEKVTRAQRIKNNVAMLAGLLKSCRPSCMKKRR